MKRVLVKSVYETFDYVMDHFAPAGLQPVRTDTYVIISIQDTNGGGFGVKFAESGLCKGVLTLYFDDIEREVEGSVAFSDEMADEIIRFIVAHKDEAETLVVHCHAGQSRSRAVGAFVKKMFGTDNSRDFENYNPNRLVYDVMDAAWIRYRLG